MAASDPVTDVLAPSWRRAVAFFVDAAIGTAVITLFALPAIGGERLIEAGDHDVSLPLKLLVLAAIYAVHLLIAGLFITRSGDRNGQTLGHQLMGLRVVREDGEAVGWNTVLLREGLFKTLLLAVADNAPEPFEAVAVLAFVAVIGLAFKDAHRRTAYDMAARTVVVRA